MFLNISLCKRNLGSFFASGPGQMLSPAFERGDILSLTKSEAESGTAQNG